MGRLSTKENKSIFQIKREEVELTREAASELTFLSADTIERIESGKRTIEELAFGYCRH